MSNPKFKVGEEVILQSHARPDLNGEYIVEAVVTEGDIVCCKITHNTGRIGQGYGYLYRLEGLIVANSKNDFFREGFWLESALRKKHQKGDMSFENLMETLKFPEKVK